MLPVIDYGSIAIVIPKITAVGVTQDENNKYCLEVFLSGTDAPILIAFDSEEEAEEEKRTGCNNSPILLYIRIWS